MDPLLKTCRAQALSMLTEYQSLSEHEHSTEKPDQQISRERATLLDCGKPIINLITRQTTIIYKEKGDFHLLQRRLDDLISLANDKFYAFPFKDVPACWRILYTDASILKACLLILRDKWISTNPNNVDSSNDQTEDDWVDELIKTLDMAVIMSGAPGLGRKEWISNLLDLLEPICSISSKTEAQNEPSQKRRKLNDYNISNEDCFPNTQSFIPPISYPIPRRSQLSLSAFEKHMHHPRDPSLGPEPLIIQNALSHWPAVSTRPWNRPSYLLSRTLGGRRLVPIEIGRSYVDSGWTQKIIPFKDFLRDYIICEESPPEEKSCATPDSQHAIILPTEQLSNAGSKRGIKGKGKGYLAQHSLLTQIPSLRPDISIPDLCYTSPPPPHPSSPHHTIHSSFPPLEEPHLNAWFGPPNTISPLHTDPYHNILTQVVGRKYVRLYAPRESTVLYARGVEGGGVDMGNTSEVDVGVWEGWDSRNHNQEEGEEEEGDGDGEKERQREEIRKKFPNFGQAKFVDCILEEGEALYIPLGWWHYVRSLSVSFSVSFWWND